MNTLHLTDYELAQLAETSAATIRLADERKWDISPTMRHLSGKLTAMARLKELELDKS